MTAVALAPAPTAFLVGLNPLAKIAAALPAMLALVFARDLTTPTTFLVLSYVLLLCGARWSARLFTMLGAVVPLAVTVVGLGFAVWVDPSIGGVAVLRVGGWTLTDGALAVGFSTGLRLAAIMTLALLGGLTTAGTDLVRALVQQLRVPYRVGYAALAAIRFVPRFGRELETIRQAQRVRGVGGFAPTRWIRTVVPLLAGAIRHAERVALAMDARAFGAHPDRTERHLVPWRRRDTAFVLAFWAVSAAVFLAV
ncbi:cobalt ABC transporter permease [Microbacterium sp. CSI-V]|uniref:energy-coupling factor transporter transmembrane component T family protein n=1 Tax=unclassified Microbacterium TaxID=2609290 RepID=UPI00097BD329|nr:energy-coupling factor transporter transmembrane component T [Microbacterium sp. CSI-V]MXS75506.1 energy-coupling factor transporter transmembrane protein EcfT [Microbacterium sp. TL13]ONI64629.1 cobalt ABC transporter permease [Microbacterium sp. CSI-V]